MVETKHGAVEIAGTNFHVTGTEKEPELRVRIGSDWFDVRSEAVPPSARIGIVGDLVDALLGMHRIVNEMVAKAFDAGAVVMSGWVPLSIRECARKHPDCVAPEWYRKTQDFCERQQREAMDSRAEVLRLQALLEEAWRWPGSEETKRKVEAELQKFREGGAA